MQSDFENSGCTSISNGPYLNEKSGRRTSLPVESVTGAEALCPGDVSDTLRGAVALRGSGHGE